MTGERDTAGVILHPPFLFLGGIAAGLLLDRLWPAAMLPGGLQYGLAGALILLGVGLFAPAALRFRRAGTNIPTNRPTTALVTDGPYRYSRNPIYVALVLAYTGIAIAIDSAWVLGLVAPILVVLRYGVIAREERYLERKFGAAYVAYKSGVRRWL